MSATIVKFDKTISPERDKVIDMMDSIEGDRWDLWPIAIGALTFVSGNINRAENLTAREMQSTVNGLAIAFVALGAMLGVGNAAAIALFGDA